MTIPPTPPHPSVRTRADLERAVRSLCYHFKTDTVVIIGSQSVLVGWPDAPVLMRTSGEIDAYPANARQWEQANKPLEASEEIFAFFGAMSAFAEAFGFYIDGVDDRTAKLPPGWKDRAVYHEVADGAAILRAIAPCTDDMIVSKLHRLVEKDREYIRACHAARPLDVALIERRLANCGLHPAVMQNAKAFLASLPPGTVQQPEAATVPTPPFPAGSHQAFFEGGGAVVVIREWDPGLGLYTKIGNPLGPATVTGTKTQYAVGGVLMTEAEWRKHPYVVRQAQAGHDHRPHHQRDKDDE